MTGQGRAYMRLLRLLVVLMRIRNPAAVLP